MNEALHAAMHPALALLPKSSEKYESTSAAAPWRRNHVAAVQRHLYAVSSGGETIIAGPEHAILALGDGIDTFIRESGIDWPSPWESERLSAAIDAFAAMLNVNLGGLDAGTLSSWASQMYDAIGWNSDAGRLRREGDE